MPLNEHMKKLLPSLIKATTDPEQSNYNPYNKKFNRVKRWCDRQLPKIQREMRKEFRARALLRLKVQARKRAVEELKQENGHPYILPDDEVVSSLGQGIRG